MELKASNPKESAFEVSDDDLKLINKLNQNGPVRPLTKDEILVRSLIVLGEEPTTKLSIHPEGDVNGRKVKSLSSLASKLPGAPMLTGHRKDKVPWARIFHADVLESAKGYKGKVLRLKHFFLNDDEGRGIAQKVDAGIWGEYSISYFFKESLCSICHRPLGFLSFLLTGKAPCKHRPGTKDEATGQMCYWYPSAFSKVGEVSNVFRGAYEKTRNIMPYSTEAEVLDLYNEEEKNALQQVDQVLASHCPVDVPADSPVLLGAEPSEGSTPGTPPDDHMTADDANLTDTEKAAKAKIKATIDKNKSKGSNQPPKPKGKEGDPPDGDKKKKPVKPCPKDPPCPEGKCNCADSAGGGDAAAGGAPPADQSAGADAGGGDGGNGGGADGDGPAGDGLTLSDEDRAFLVDLDDPELDQAEIEDALIIHAAGDEPRLALLKTELAAMTAPPGPDTTTDEPLPTFLSCPECGLAKDAPAKCVCPKCGEETDTPAGKPCPKCPKCKTQMKPAAKNADNDQVECPECSTLMELMVEQSRILECADCGHTEPADAGIFSAPADKRCPAESCGAALVLVLESYASPMRRQIGPIKPAKSGASNNEFFDKKAFKDLESGRYYIEPKYDGVFFELHKKGDSLKLITDEGNDHANKFPGIMDEAKKLKSDNFIVVGEIVKYRGNKRLSHSDVTAWIQSKQDTYNDKPFRFKPFDMPVAAGKSLQAAPLEQRRQTLDKEIPWGDQIHPTSGRWVKHEKGNTKIVTAIDDRKTREGTMIKAAGMTYNKAGRKLIWKWKQQHEIDCKVKAIKTREGGGYVYTCTVGSGNAAQVIGDTFTTKIKAAVGDILSVSVDRVTYNEKDKSFSWTAPKVTARRTDKKQADPISTLKRIAETKNADESTAGSVVLLGEIVPALKRVDVGQSLFLTGSIVEHGLTTHDVDIVTRKPLTDENKSALKESLGPRLSALLDFTHDPEGPAGPALEIRADMSDEVLADWKFAKRFVMQRHGWGRKEHYDIRFGAPKTPRMWGFTCFSKPSQAAGNVKVRCQEKKYHDPKWMSVNKPSIKPGEPGHPGVETFKGNAHMVVEDKGKYDYIRRKPGFLEVVLHGKDWKGRYLFREIQVKSTKNASDSLKVGGDEVAPKSEKIWIMWKPKEQETKKPINKLGYSWHGPTLLFWETNEPDTEIESLEDLPVDTGDLDFVEM
jgi:hypothetical protein